MPLASIADLNGPVEEVTKYIEMAKELSALYDEFILLDQDDGSHRAPGIHASELYPCLRKPVYSVLDVEKKPMVAKFWKQRFKMGHAVHEMVQKDFHKIAKRSQQGKAMHMAERMAEEMDCFLEFEDEVRISPDRQALAKHYNIHSSADGIFTFRHKVTGLIVLRVGLEIKTESPDQFAQLTEPKFEHVRQTHLYMACLDLPLMWFFYMNKGNQNNTDSKAPWLITWQPQIWEELRARIELVHEYAAKKELPDRTDGILCQFCPWSHTCLPPSLNRAPTGKPTRRETIRKPGT